MMGDANSLTFMTYNILEPRLAEKWPTPAGLDPATGKSNWATRAGQLAANIAHAQPDVLFLQEVSPTAIPPLPDYMELSDISLHPGAHPDTPYGCAIAFNKKRFRGDACTLFAAPDHQRAACMAGLWDRQLKMSYFVLSAHLKHHDYREPDEATRNAAAATGTQELRAFLSSLDEYIGPQLFVIAGDFNMDPRESDDRAGLMRKFHYLTSTERRVTRPSTNREIDFIYALGCTQEEISEPEIDWPYPNASDHLPRLLKIQLT